MGILYAVTCLVDELKRVYLGAAEEAKKRSVTPLQNISNNASSEEVGHHNGDGDAPPAKRARKGATNEATSPQVDFFRRFIDKTEELIVVLSP